MDFRAKKKKSGEPVGVDIDARSVAAAEVGQDGRAGKSGVAALSAGAFSDGEVTDPNAITEALKELFDKHKLNKQVRLAVANQRVAFRTVRLPLIEDPEQLRAAVTFQAQEQIPMPLDTAVLDYQVIGGSVSEEGSRQIDVAVVAAREASVLSLLEVARRAGLDPVGVDLAAFGMIRALAPAGNATAAGEDPSQEEFVQASLYCNLGDQTNLAIARDRTCLFSRVAQYGVRDVADQLVGATGLPAEHAEQWLVHAGLTAPLEEIEGDADTAQKARAALEGGLSRIADELRLSLDYYGSQEGATPVDGVVLCGWGSAIPGLAAGLAEVLGRRVEARLPGALDGLDAAAASRLTVPYGLALEQ